MDLILMGLTSSTCEVALIPRVPVTDLPTVAVAIEAVVAGVSCHPLTQATALLTRLPPLMAIGLRQARAVAVGVIASHRGCRGHAWTKTTTLLTVIRNTSLVT